MGFILKTSHGNAHLYSPWLVNVGVGEGKKKSETPRMYELDGGTIIVGLLVVFSGENK